MRLNKKEFIKFLENQDETIDFLINTLNKNVVEGAVFEDFTHQIDEIQKFYEEKFLLLNSDSQNKLRLAFWAFFSKLLIMKLGGELRIAPKNDYCEGTPQLINYGNKFDKKGKKMDWNRFRLLVKYTYYEIE